MHVIIIGAGIAGGALALFLKRAGLTSVVYDAHARPGNIGGGFQIAPNGMNVLKELGLSDTLTASSAQGKNLRFLRPDFKEIASFRNGRPEVNGVTAVLTTRTAFCKTLLDEVEKQGLSVEYGKRLRDITYTDQNEVVAHFEDGTTAQGAFLVGADGMGSRTRARILPDGPQASYSGVVGFGGSVLSSSLPKPIVMDRTACTFVLGPVGQFGYVCVDHEGDRCNWWCHEPQEKEPTKAELKAMTIEAMLPKLLERYGSWHEPIPTLIKHTQPLTAAAVYKLDPLSTWHKRNVLLIGDAAHGMTPSAGQGASLALEDAMYLGKLLNKSTSPLEEVFAQFERERRPRAERCAALARARDVRENVQLSPFQCWMRNRMLSVVMPLFGERNTRWQYEYRIAWDSA